MGASDEESTFSADPPSSMYDDNQSILSSLAELPSKAKRRQMKNDRHSKAGGSSKAKLSDIEPPDDNSEDAHGRKVRSRSRHMTRKDPRSVYDDEESTVASESLASRSVYSSSIISEEPTPKRKGGGRSSSKRSSKRSSSNNETTICTSSCSPFSLCTGVNIKTLIFCIIGTTVLLKLTSEYSTMDSILQGRRPVARDLKGQYYSYVSNGGLRGATAPSYNDVDEVEGEEEGGDFHPPPPEMNVDKEEGEEEEEKNEEEENVSDEDEDTSGGVNESNNSLLNNDIEMNIDNSEENANEVGGEKQEIFDPPEDITESQQDQFNAQMGLLSQSTTLGGDIPQQLQNQEPGEGDGNDASQDQVENNGSQGGVGSIQFVKEVDADQVINQGGFTNQLQLPPEEEEDGGDSSQGLQEGQEFTSQVSQQLSSQQQVGGDQQGNVLSQEQQFDQSSQQILQGQDGTIQQTAFEGQQLQLQQQQQLSLDQFGSSFTQPNQMHDQSMSESNNLPSTGLQSSFADPSQSQQQMIQGQTGDQFPQQQQQPVFDQFGSSSQQQQLQASNGDVSVQQQQQSAFDLNQDQLVQDQAPLGGDFNSQQPQYQQLQFQQPNDQLSEVHIESAQQRLEEHSANGYDVTSTQDKLNKLQELQAQVAAKQSEQQQQFVGSATEQQQAPPTSEFGQQQQQQQQQLSAYDQSTFQQPQEQMNSLSSSGAYGQTIEQSMEQQSQQQQIQQEQVAPAGDAQQRIPFETGQSVVQDGQQTQIIQEEQQAATNPYGQPFQPQQMIAPVAQLANNVGATADDGASTSNAAVFDNFLPM